MLATRQDENKPSQQKCTTITALPKKIWKISYSYIPANLKISTLMGSGVFNADHFARLVLTRDTGLDHPLGIALSCINIAGIGVTNYVTRFRNMTRNYIPKNHNEGCSCEVPYEVKNAGWFSADKSQEVKYSLPHRIGYVGQQGVCVIYMVISSGAGILAGYSLVSLGSSITKLSFHPECSDKQSSAYILIPVFGFSVALSLSNARSFYLYNIQRIRNYYHKFIYHQKYKEISFSSYLKTLIAISVNSIGVFFSNRQLLKMIHKFMLCHLGISEPPSFVNKILMYSGSIINFFVTGMMMAPAIHHGNNAREYNIDTLLNNLPRWKYLINPLRYFAFVDSSALMLNVFVSIYSLPETVNDENATLETSSFSILMIIIAALLAINAGLSQYALDFEGIITEIKATFHDLRDPQLAESLIDSIRGEENTTVIEEKENETENTLSAVRIYNNPLSPTLYQPSSKSNSINAEPISVTAKESEIFFKK